MRLLLSGRHLEITDAIRSYVEEKFGKTANHFDQIMEIEVTLHVINNPSVALSHEAEATCHVFNSKIHVKEHAESMYASIDLLADKLERQVRKAKERLTSKAKTSIRTSIEEPVIIEPEEEPQADNVVNIDLQEE